MNSYKTVNEVLVTLFREIMDIEERALITSEYKDVSVKDMHVMEAIGVHEPRNMSAVAIAVNHLVKKGYVERVRSNEDRRVVLVSLSEKGERAYLHHRMFHEKMVMSVLEGLDQKETEVLTAALKKLQRFFDSYKTE